MMKIIENIDEVIEARLREFKQSCAVLPPLQIPERIGQILLQCGFVQDLKGFNLIKNGDKKHGNN